MKHEMTSTVPDNAIDPNHVKPIKLEDDELDEGEIGRSSPSVLIEDFDRTSVIAGDGTLRNQLRLASYEYEELEQRYKKLVTRHDELGKLCSAYRDIISGFSHYEEQSSSIEQLRAEAGREGMRAKALEADVLRPVIREAGGLQALVSQMQSMRSLTDKVGGLRELEELVSDVNLFRIGLDEVGGLQGLYNLIAEVKALRQEQLASQEARDRVEGLNGLATKAAKYDKLTQAFHDIQAMPEHGAPVGTATINPARASLIASTPLEADPYRDLYEVPPVKKPHSKTGSNNIPLGPARIRGQPSSQARGQPTLKREPLDDLEETISKRPRLEPGHASVWVQRSMTRFLVDRSYERHEQLPGRGTAQSQPKIITKLEDLCSTEVQRPRASSRQPSIPPILTATAEDFHLSRSMMAGRYPIALWTGTVDPCALLWPGLKKNGDIPLDLGKFLAGELSKYITDVVVHLFDQMPPNNDTCVLRYLLDGHRPSGQPQTRRACLGCFRHRRPCALLLELESIPTVVFMPLPGRIGEHKDWNKQNYWIMNTE